MKFSSQDLEDQKLRSEQEIQTLQQIIQETCDEVTMSNNEIIRLQENEERMRQEIQSMRDTFAQQQQVRHHMFKY
jgi:chromosome segregation ATPase